MDGKADLHLHTTFSDGALSPSELIERARQAGLTTIAITDHDHTGGLEEAALSAGPNGIDVIPGVELSTSIGDADVHILAYFINRRMPPAGTSRAFQDRAAARAEKIVEKLNGHAYPADNRRGAPQGREGIGRPAAHRDGARGRGADRVVPGSVFTVYRVRQTRVREEIPGDAARGDRACRGGGRTLVPCAPVHVH